MPRADASSYTSTATEAAGGDAGYYCDSWVSAYVDESEVG